MLQLWFFANSLLWPFSIGIGGLKLGLNVIILTVAGAVWIVKNYCISALSAKVLFGLFVFFVFSCLVAVTGTCADKFQKFVLTAPVLFLLTLLGLEIGRRATISDWLQLQSVSQWVLLLAFAGFLFEALLPGFFPSQAGYRTEGKLSGLFHEPSHVAFSLFPSIAILLVSGNALLMRKGKLALVGLVLISRSSTLMVLIIAWLLYRLSATRNIKLGRGLLSGLVLIIAAVLASLAYHEQVVAPVLDRAAGVFAMDETENISSLVYIQGWQDAWANLQRTNGLGLGFNMMGCSPLPDVPARYVLASAFNIELNAEDGSFLFSKIVSEAGVVGVLIFITLIWWLIRMDNNIRLNNTIEKSSVMPMLTALMFLFIASSLIRSPGYFCGGLQLLVVAAASAPKLREMHKFKYGS